LDANQAKYLPEGQEDNDPLFQQDTKDLVVELLRELFGRHYGAATSAQESDSLDALSIILDLVSVHPCGDFNGRTTRFVGFLVAIEGGEPHPFQAYISDFDLMMKKSNYAKFVNAGAVAFFNLRMRQFEELLLAWTDDRMADQYSLPSSRYTVGGTQTDGWLTWMNEAVVPFKKDPKKPVIPMGPEDWTAIEKRRFVDLMDKMLGKDAWNYRDSAN